MPTATRLAWIVLPLGLASVSGCVSHAPVSETVMFHAAQTSPRHANKRGVGVAVTHSPTPETPRGECDDCARINGLPLNARQNSVGIYRAGYDPKGRWAVGATAGVFVLGLDGTVRLTNRNYVVVGASLGGSAQAWAMHRALNVPRAGAAVGAGFWQTGYTFDDECYCFPQVSVRNVGVRATALVARPPNDPSRAFRVNATLGYAPSLGRTTLQVGLVMGTH